MSWQQPAHSNGKIKYRLSINTVSEQSAFYQVVYDGNNTQYLVSDLKPFTKYNLQVTAYNVKYNLSSLSVVAMETTSQAGRLLLGDRSFHWPDFFTNVQFSSVLGQLAYLVCFTSFNLHYLLNKCGYLSFFLSFFKRVVTYLLSNEYRLFPRVEKTIVENVFKWCIVNSVIMLKFKGKVVSVQVAPPPKRVWEPYLLHKQPVGKVSRKSHCRFLLTQERNDLNCDFSSFFQRLLVPQRTHAQ